MFDISIFVSEERLNEFLVNPQAKKLKKDLAYQAASSILSKFRELRQKTSEFDMNPEIREILDFIEQSERGMV